MMSGSGLEAVSALARIGRLEEAFRLLQQLAERGSAEALALLGDYCWQGRIVERDPVRARDLYRRASDSGDPRSHILYTNLLASGVAGEADWAAAIVRLNEEASHDPRRRRALECVRAMDLTEIGDPCAMPRPEPHSSAPEIAMYRALLSPEECAYLLDLAEPGYRSSTVYDPRGGDIADPFRTSEGSPIHWLLEDPAVHALNRRLAAASGSEAACGEPLLILRYRPGDEYRRHFDALPNLENQRRSTVLVYLNADYEGGETEFWRLPLKVKGQAGDALVFRNTGPDDRVDPRSEHAGLPVTRGTKYVASRWVRAQRHQP